MLAQELESAFDGISKIEQGDLPRVLYHYTSVTGLSGIVSHRQIWASHFAFMNDPGELRHADEHIRGAVDSMRDGAHGVGRVAIDRFLSGHPAERIYYDFDIFVACFSEDGDSLPQWRAYADDGKGYALGLDTTYGGRQEHPVPCGNHGTYAVDMYKVEYSAQRIVEQLRQFVQRLTNITEQCEQKGAPPADLEFQAYRALRIRAAHDSIRHKHSAFEHEREWRMITIGSTPNRRNRPCRGVPLPFVALELTIDDDLLPVHEVRVGPGHALRGTLNAARLGTADLLSGKCMRTDTADMVLVSEIPYQPQ
jgi:hypothetical protein